MDLVWTQGLTLSASPIVPLIKERCDCDIQARCKIKVVDKKIEDLEEKENTKNRRRIICTNNRQLWKHRLNK